MFCDDCCCYTSVRTTVGRVLCVHLCAQHVHPVRIALSYSRLKPLALLFFAYPLLPPSLLLDGLLTVATGGHQGPIRGTQTDGEIVGAAFQRTSCTAGTLRRLHGQQCVSNYFRYTV